MLSLPATSWLEAPFLFLALLLAAGAGLAGRLDEHGLVLAAGLGRALLRVVELLHEVGLDLAAALLPPLLLGVRLRLDLGEALP